ncbi:MAG: thioesterase [Flavobacteriaceae bacterium]|nr:MAG: thioesterase [Flavobacteriaceae bacterium]
MSKETRKYNTFTFFKLPAAWWCGMRLTYIDEEKAVVTIKHKWFNQNPFKSMFWAAQGMAAEFSTGTLVINQIRNSGKKISMLVASNKATFTKKATGRITFTCVDGHLIKDAISKTIATGEGQIFWMKSIGVNEDGAVVSTFDFEWTVRVKNK